MVNYLKITKKVPKYDLDNKELQSRFWRDYSSSQTVPSFFGGSADLAGSNKSNVKEAKDYDKETPEGKTYGLVYVNLPWVQQ